MRLTFAAGARRRLARTAPAALGPSTAESSLVADTSTVEADGVDAALLTATVRDVAGQPLAGVTPVMEATGSGNTLGTFGPTNAGGVAQATFQTTGATSHIVIIKVKGLTVAASVTITGTGASGVGYRRSSLVAYPTPTPPTPLREFYVNASTGNDNNAGTSGSPFKTLSKVTATAIAGDCFYLAGTFNAAGDSADRLGSATANAGTASNRIQIRQWTGQAQAILAGGGGNYPPLWLTSAMDYWWFHGIQVNGTAFGVDGVLTQANSTNHTFTSVTFNNCAVHLITSPDTVLYDCTWTGTVGTLGANNGDGIFIQNGSHRVKVIRGVWNGTIWHSVATISYQGSSEATCDDCVFSGNRMKNPGAGGLILNGKATRTIVEDNIIEECGLGGGATRLGIEVEGTDCIVRDNRVAKNYRQGISLQARTFAGFLAPCSGNHVHNNTIYGNGGVPIEMVVRDVGVMTNNIIENNLGWANNAGGQAETWGYYSGVYYQVWVDCFNANQGGPGVWTTTSAVSGNILRNNHLARVASAEGFVVVSRTAGNGGTFTRTVAEAQGGWSGWANNRIDTDPLLVDPANGDFALGASSVVIDAGYATVGEPSIGAGVDIGAYEKA